MVGGVVACCWGGGLVIGGPGIMRHRVWLVDAGYGVLAGLVMFYAATMIIFTMYGGGFATIPAYPADIFGTLHVGGIHGRLLTAWSVAGVLGAVSITSLRTISRYGSVAEFAANTVIVAWLMEIAPPGRSTPPPRSTTRQCMRRRRPPRRRSRRRRSRPPLPDRGQGIVPSLDGRAMDLRCPAPCR